MTATFFFCCAAIPGTVALLLAISHLASGTVAGVEPCDECAAAHERSAVDDERSVDDEHSVVVVVPCRGNGDPGLADNLRSIVTQDFGGSFKVVFVVESHEDPALASIEPLVEEFDNVTLCVAGLAKNCAQKSHNVVSAIKTTDGADVILFADSDIRPHSNWLRNMVAPLRDPKVDVATGFFHVVPEAQGFEWGNYLSGILGAALWQGVSSDYVKGIWGGSMAIRYSVLVDCDLFERLETEIVDDIVVMHAVHKHDLRRVYVPSCVLTSYCQRTVTETFEWFVRQTQYSQIYFKPIFWLGHAAVFPYLLAILAAPVLFVYGFVAPSSISLGASAGIVLFALFNTLLLWPGMPNRATPANRSFRMLPWLITGPSALLLAAIALIETHRRVRGGVLHMRWRCIDYDVDVNTGKVLKVLHAGAKPPNFASKPHQTATTGADRHQAVGTH